MFYANDGRAAWALFNFDYGLCVIGSNQSFDGGLTYHWQYQQNLGIKESDMGLQYFDHNNMGWKLFDNEVQEEYAGYKLENEIK